MDPIELFWMKRLLGRLEKLDEDWKLRPRRTDRVLALKNHAMTAPPVWRGKVGALCMRKPLRRKDLRMLIGDLREEIWAHG